MLRWFEQNGPEGDVVISSRVRLARNLKDYNFSLKLDTPDAHKMIGERHKSCVFCRNSKIFTSIILRIWKKSSAKQ